MRIIHGTSMIRRLLNWPSIGNGAVSARFTRALHPPAPPQRAPDTEHEPQRAAASREEMTYVFRRIRNESIVKGFAYGTFNAKLLKMPDADSPDDAVRALCDKLATVDLGDYDRGRDALRRLGVFGALIPKQYGGLGLTATQYAYLVQNERLVEWSLVLIAHTNLCSQAILQFGSEEQKSHYLPRLASGELLGAFCLNEEASGSDMFSMTSTASLDVIEENYVLRGTKNWVINGHTADVFVVFTMSQDSLYEGGRSHITAFIVDRETPGVSVSEPYDIDWLTNGKVADVSLHDALVPVSNVLFEEHGGYKIANQIQNSARCIIASCMAGIVRLFIDDLASRESSGLLHTGDNTFVRHFMEECAVHLYAIESCLYFTTRFSDLYVLPEIELESAVVKVFSTESAVRVLEHHQSILQLVGHPIDRYFEMLFRRVRGLQNFLGSNYFTRLYIGGTMVQLCSVSLTELARRARQTPLTDMPWTTDSRRSSSSSFSPGDGNVRPRYSMFLDELVAVYKNLNMCKYLLTKALHRYRNNTLEHQFIMTAMSDLAEIIYVLSCCVARANTTCGDFEIRATQNFIKKANLVIDESMKALKVAANSYKHTYVEEIAEDIKIAKGYPSHDILEIRRGLGKAPEPKRNIFDEYGV